MRWLVTGASGQLGSEIVPLVDGIGLDRTQLDITSAESIHAALDEHAVDVIVNCAAWTAVDDAEAHEDEAAVVNALGPSLLADACRERGLWLVQVSTDYVFDGLSATPYDESDPVDPRSAYGRTKAAGESAVLAYDKGIVVRTAWLYGAHGGNFVRTMLRLERERDVVQVVDDQIGQPTWAADVARSIRGLTEAVARGDAGTGAWHATNAGRASWWEFARVIFSGIGADADRVVPVSSEAFPRPAKRPAFSVLGHDRWAASGLPTPRPWQDALAEALPSIVASS